MVTVASNVDAAAEKLRADRNEEALMLAEFKIRQMREEIMDLIKAEGGESEWFEFERGYVTGLEIARGIVEHWCHEYLFQRGEKHGRIITGTKARDFNSGKQGVSEDNVSDVQRIQKE